MSGPRPDNWPIQRPRSVSIAYANGVPPIVFHSLLDPAGGDAGTNQMTTFTTLVSVNSVDTVRSFVAS